MKIKLSIKKLKCLIEILDECGLKVSSEEIKKAIAESDEKTALKDQAKKQKETKEKTEAVMDSAIALFNLHRPLPVFDKGCCVKLLNDKIRLERLHKQLEITLSALKIQAENGSMNDKTLNKFDELKDQIERYST